ncbi:hypothetical protein J2T57_001695 [Natronocella acetinitrilica]|uniref:Uncharacterized protein n=1 Tax=Natronocella acetinitrilica TaxID=414046 RepID=A0AAE3G556_9GAMM|nr:PcfJ domain-containing protein [Natronocella acetinitrilica]MCP1674593.1 hypothetical protein [Natronocella acetinitrilica]
MMKTPIAAEPLAPGLLPRRERADHVSVARARLEAQSQLPLIDWPRIWRAERDCDQAIRRLVDAGASPLKALCAHTALTPRVVRALHRIGEGATRALDHAEPTLALLSATPLEFWPQTAEGWQQARALAGMIAAGTSACDFRLEGLIDAPFEAMAAALARRFGRSAAVLAGQASYDYLAFWAAYAEEALPQAPPLRLAGGLGRIVHRSEQWDRLMDHALSGAITAWSQRCPEARAAGWPGIQPARLREILGVRVTELTTPGALVDEAIALRHCAGSYAPRCFTEHYRLFSLATDTRRSTLALRLCSAPGEPLARIHEHRGPNNTPAPALHGRVAEALIERLHGRHRRVLAASAPISVPADMPVRSYESLRDHLGRDTLMAMMRGAEPAMIRLALAGERQATAA